MTFRRLHRLARGQEGSGTLVALVALTVVLCAGLLTWAVAEAVVAHQRASVAADLAAIAGAAEIRRGGGAPCAASDRIARANGATLEECVVEGGDVMVTVGVPPPPLLGRLAASAGEEPPGIRAAARAGRPGENGVE